MAKTNQEKILRALDVALVALKDAQFLAYNGSLDATIERALFDVREARDVAEVS